MNPPTSALPLRAPAPQRLAQIDAARRSLLDGEGRDAAGTLVQPWIVQSWQRCLANGQHPRQRLGFDLVSREAMRRTQEANQHLARTARPLLEKLARAIAQTRYFAILTNREGVVVDAEGAIDHSDRRAHLITRVGVDLSERAVGTTAIGAALGQLHPVWLHRGEHFFDDTAVYSCAGAPILDPDGHCAGMLDLTGVQADERPQLRHLASQYARGIENALLMARPHALVLRLSWPGRGGGDDDGLVTLDADGWVTGVNPAAREMLGLAPGPRVASGAGETNGPGRPHADDVFAMSSSLLFDAARHRAAWIEIPLWSGLRLQAQVAASSAHARGHARALVSAPPARSPAPADAASLRDIETALIRQAVDEARGNVARAAQALGISRATVYRKLGQRPRGPGDPGRG